MPAQSHEKLALAPMPEGSEKIFIQAKTERNRQARIYSRTHSMMSIRTEKMFAFASRDYQRQQHLPMKRTSPALLKRRYSIEVSTDAEERKVKRIRNGEVIEETKDALETQSSIGDKKRNIQAIECVTPFTFSVPFPKPHRYYDFNKYYYKDNQPKHDNSDFLHLGVTSLTNGEFYNIIEISGYDCWLVDTQLDAALALLSIDKACVTSSIGIGSSVVAQVARNPDRSGKQEYTRDFGDKRWIFLPVNDGMSEDITSDQLGTHWTLVALDRVHKRMHYFNSLRTTQAYWNLAIEVAKGMLEIVGDDADEWKYIFEVNTPHQWYNNLARFDGGPCGVFVYTMVKIFVEHIQRSQEEGEECKCELMLPNGFPEDFGGWWNSVVTRQEMQQRMAIERKERDIQRWAADHDAAALEGSNIELVDKPALRFPFPQRQTSQTNSHSRKRSSSEAVSDSDSTLSAEPSGNINDDAYEGSSLNRAASPQMGIRTLSSGEDDGFAIVDVDADADVDVGGADVVSVSSDASGSTEEIFLGEE